MSLKTISLVDIRAADKHARERIPGATNVALSEIKLGRPELKSPRGVIQAA